MDAKDKADFIRELCDRVRDSAIADIDRMPPDWDGHELRQLPDRRKVYLDTPGTL